MVVSSAYLRLLVFLPAVLIPACESSSPAFCMMYSAYKLNKQSVNIQSCHTPFPILNQSIVSCPVLTVASWPAYRFLRRHVGWSDIPISLRIFQFVAIQAVSCFFYDPVDVGNLISGSSAFSKSSLYIQKFSVHKLLKPSLKDFEYYLASMWNECNCVVIWASLTLPFFGTGMKTDLFQSCGHCWVFQIFWHIECSTLIASSFRIWNSLAGIPSPPLALFLVMLPNAHLALKDSD